MNFLRGCNNPGGKALEERSRLLPDLAAECRGLVDVAAGLLPPPVDDWDYPLTVLLRLQAQAATQYAALATVASDPGTVGAADVLLRSLLECVALLAWILEATGGTAAESRRSTRTRALCADVDASDQIVNQVRQSMAVTVRDRLLPIVAQAADAMPALRDEPLLGQLLSAAPDNLIDTAVQGLQMARDQIRELHRATGCRCRGHRSSTKPLRAMAPDDALAHLFWQIGSGSAHHLYPGLTAGTVASADTGMPGAPMEDLQRLYLSYSTDLFVSWTGRVIDHANGDSSELRREGADIALRLAAGTSFGPSLKAAAGR